MLRTYFNQKATIWDETVAEKDTARLEQMCQRLDIKSGTKLLDVGTGTGVFLPYLSKKVGDKGQIMALDFAEEMLKIARSKGFNGNIEYVCADVAEIPCDNEAFDCVVCYSSFPHFQDKPKALAEINRVTKRGGRLFICHTSSRDKINQIHCEIPTVQNDLIPDEDEMRILLSAAGFTDIEIEDNSDNYLAIARTL